MKNAQNKTRLVNLYIAQSSVTIALQVQKREKSLENHCKYFPNINIEYFPFCILNFQPSLHTERAWSNKSLTIAGHRVMADWNQINTFRLIRAIWKFRI